MSICRTRRRLQGAVQILGDVEVAGSPRRARQMPTGSTS
jgi:hypothetical protein